MNYTVYRIFEDDYGCEERDESAPELVLLLLRDEAQQEHMLRVEEALLSRLGIDEGSTVSVSEDGTLTI